MLANSHYRFRDGLRSRGAPQDFLFRTTLVADNVVTRAPDPSEQGLIGYRRFVRDSEAANEGPAHLPRLGAKEEVFSRLLAFWNLDKDQGAALLGLQLEGARQVTDILNGVAYFRSQDELDRVAELFEIRRLLHGLYRDQATENRWLRHEQVALQGQTPLAVMLGGHMTDILKVRQLVETIAGL